MLVKRKSLFRLIEPPIKRKRTVFEFIKEQQFDKPLSDIVNECSVVNRCLLQTDYS